MLFYTYWISSDDYSYGLLLDRPGFYCMRADNTLAKRVWDLSKQDADIQFAVRNKLYLAIREVAE